jgi:hypothetical protein
MAVNIHLYAPAREGWTNVNGLGEGVGPTADVDMMAKGRVPVLYSPIRNIIKFAIEFCT